MVAKNKKSAKPAAPKGKAKPDAKAAKPAAKASKPAVKAPKAAVKPSTKAAVAPAKKSSSAKPAAASAKTKTTGKKPVAPAKPAAPAKKTAPAAPQVSPKKPATVAKTSAAAAKPATAPKGASPVKAKEPAHHAPAAAAKKPATAEAKAPAKVATPPVRKSSLVDFPVPPPPVKPPFVPPKPVSNGTSDTANHSGGGGSHSPAFIQKQRQRLLDLRDELVDAMSGMTRDTIRNAPEGSEASGSGQHQGDAGSDAYDRDFALSVLAKEQDALYEIEQALRRIQSGTYGICEISTRKIPQARLEAIPFARLTVECQAQWEKEYGKRRFRPSNEVGFSGGNYVEDEDSETVSLDEDED